jgi:hypothetical protein
MTITNPSTTHWNEYRITCAAMPFQVGQDLPDLLRSLVLLPSGNALIETFARLNPETRTERLAIMSWLRISVSLISNNLVPYRSYNDEPTLCDIIFEWFQIGGNWRFLRTILSEKIPTINAFAEVLLSSAILAEDCHITEILLESGVSTETLVRYDQGCPSSGSYGF